MRMRRRMLRSQQNHEFVARPADITRADGEDGVPWASLLEQELDAFLHRTKIMDVIVAVVANGASKAFAGYARDGRFASRINGEQHEDVRLIERTAEFIPKVLSARITMRLEEHKQAIELASAGRFERGANFGGVMAIVVNDGNVVDHALDIKAAAHAGKLSETFADQVSGNVQIEGNGGGRRSVANVVHAGRMRQTEQAEVFTSVGELELAA